MKIAFSGSSLPAKGCLIVAVSEGPKFGKLSGAFDKRGLDLDAVAKEHGFKGKAGEALSLLSQGKFSRLLVVGLGDAGKLSAQKLAEAGGAACAMIPANKVEEVAVIVAPDLTGSQRAEAEANFAQGFLLRSYRFDKYFTKTPKDKKPILAKLTVLANDEKAAKKAFDPLLAVAEGVFFARSLVSEPGNVLYPEALANACKKLKDLGVTVEILLPADMKKLGMGSLLGVAQGSVNGARLVTMRYNGAGKGKNKAPIAFIGKGVTFDTGGISLKPAGGMEDMKYDMAGSAAVVGTIYALAARKAKANAVGVIGCVENMPDGNAQRPGDVVTSMSGQTIEVINTDAEGRLVLCDLLTYTQQKFKPAAMVNLATLTGAIILALGNEHGGLFCNNDQLADQLTKAGLSTEEKLWRFPMNDAYDRQLNSDIADMKNSSNERVAGSIYGAQFLARFVDKAVPWAHLDIAGMAWAKRDLPLVPKGATAYGVRMLNKLVEDFYEK